LSAYLPIADHGLIGDLYSVALIETDDATDWHCCPRSDAPSVFASILDARRGGHYRLAPVDQGSSSKQLYSPDNYVLITRFLSSGGVAEVEDFLAVAQTNFREHRQRLVRQVAATRSEVPFEPECSPRFDYGRAGHAVAPHEHDLLFQSANCVLALETDW
jgi:GH15 family glucan-1,4-alpha-glucosidase